MTRNATELGAGLWVTAQLFLIAVVVGFSLGIPLGAGSARRPWIARGLKVVVFFLSGLPILILLFWAHYPLQAILRVVINPFITASAVLASVNVIAVAEIVRVLLRDFPGQYETVAALCGLRKGMIFWRIKLPMLLRAALPALLIQEVSILHATLFAGLISVPELFRTAQRINASEYKPVEIYTLLALAVLALSLPLNAIAWWYRSRMRWHWSEA